MDKRKCLNLLGLAQNAGALQSGDFIVEKACKRKQGCLLLVASDCASNNSEKYEYLSGMAGLPLRRAFTKEEMGHAIGKAQRAVILVMNEGFAKALLKELDS